ncbi:Sapep family Mn(2+)-dependent dipeptidase [Borrelia anserina]|uniref:Aminoacyl-histidine dipeptidase n=2 Tax=Borrelia anserina TaxID=143 RepID=W5SU31_BORAN|nr:Sapep family Mn(2+)-dependent dipeptidase [Borrelia anserina]AHH08546.1 Aminoacyl-histidine dipeptidase [Borrelia anserina BA2]APR65014.1 Xaa-His dipeptidase [Borrelia anserina Es]UPA06938.1 Sapep family Mn(2+)-dependent dipeptidase [Borrelia anserina]
MDFNLEKQFYFHLGELVKFNSVNAFASENKPFGEQIDLCLDKVLEIAQGIGFKVYKDRDGYYGFADIGQGDEIIGILTHIDIVDAGNLSNWYSDPFKLSFKDGKVYARGVLDDKGPLMTILYAFKLLILEGIFFKKRFRVIFGTDEETSWRCIEKYKLKEEIPDFSFTPDGDFPVVNAEKGLLQFDVISNERFFMDFELGTGYNVIPDKCSFVLGDSNKDDFRILLDSFGGKIRYKFLENNVLIHGTSAHASLPELGVNVAPYALSIIKSLGVKADFINFFEDKIGFTVNGEKLFGRVLEDSISGQLTLCLTKIKLSKISKQILSFDMRYPVSFKREELVSLIKGILSLYSLDYHEVSFLEPLYIDSSLQFVESLLEVYKNFTGESDVSPIAIGGATYSRSLKNCVAFGPLFKGSDNTAHKTNECIDEGELVNLILIYKNAIEKLNT